MTFLMGLVTGISVSAAIRVAFGGQTLWPTHAACALLSIVSVALYIREKYSRDRTGRGP